MMVVVSPMTIGAGEDPPNVRFAHDRSSPAIVITGLRDNTTDYIIAEVHRRIQGVPNGVGGNVVSTRVDLHDLTRTFMRDPDAAAAAAAKGGPRVLSCPDFLLNQTAALRLTIWYPCDDVPSGVGILPTPCFYERIDPAEYLDPAVHGHRHTTVGRRTVFAIHHPGHINETWLDLARKTVERDSERAAMLQKYAAEDYRGATTRATCWYPSAGSTEHDMLPINLKTHMHRLLLGDLHYKRPVPRDRRRRSGQSADQEPPAWLIEKEQHDSVAVDPQPEGWYGSMKAVENTDATLMDPIDRSGNPVAVHGRRYCRSIITVSTTRDNGGSGGARGWSVVSGGRDVGEDDGILL